MYQVVEKIPDNWDIDRDGHALVVLEDEYGGQSVISMDDHCYVLYNGSNNTPFQMTSWWYREAAEALAKYIIQQPKYPEGKVLT